jgi:methyl-accepting chemotaxis protein
MLINGDWDDGIKHLQTADNNFMKAFEKAERNTSIINNKIYLENIFNSYSDFKKNLKFPIEKEEGQENIDWYYKTIHNKLQVVVDNVNVFIEINQKNIYDETLVIKNHSKRAIIPGIVAIIASVVYLLMLNFFITKFMIAPINRITQAIKDFRFGSKSFNAKISSNDELKELEKSISRLTDKVSSKMEN